MAITDASGAVGTAGAVGTSSAVGTAGAGSVPWVARLAARHASRPGPDVVDWAIAVGCFALFTLPAMIGASSPGGAAAFGAAAAAPLVLRRRWPVPTVAAVTAVYVAAALAGVGFTRFVSNAGPDLAVAAFTAADRCRRGLSLTAAAAAAGATWAGGLAAIHLHQGRGEDAIQAAAVAAAWMAGDMARTLRRYQRQLASERGRRSAEEQQRVQAEDRLRLSREVHDILSHSLSAIAVQAGAARMTLDRQPAQAGAALSAIESASRAALEELRSLLRQIRDPRAHNETATPTLSELSALAGKLRQSGLDLDIQVTGRAREYPVAVELSAYRIVQEALTNVMKHAPGASARVEIGHRDDELVITVANSPVTAGIVTAGIPVSSAEFGGFGIRGMRERASLLGGTLAAGPARDGGFTVTARLPVHGGGS